MVIVKARLRAGLVLPVLFWCAMAFGAQALAMELTSSAFKQYQYIPIQYTCDGSDLSPPLAWTAPPPGTKSLALICDDPDAPVGVWVHWVLYGLPARAMVLAEGAGKAGQSPQGAIQGRNDFGRLGYGGPCPPPGRPHRYFFKLYALDTVLKLRPGATKKELVRAMEGHVLEKAQWVGLYRR